MSVAPISWDGARRVVQQLALERGEWAGYPMPLDGLTLRVSDRVFYRNGESLHGARLVRPEPRACTVDDVDETVAIRNRWWSIHRNAYVVVYEERGRVQHALVPDELSRGGLLIGTLEAVSAWDLDAERRAVSKLGELVTDQAFKCYLLTGSFLETSKRSNVTYLFRRLRPTLAIGRNERDGLRILAALCMHPIAYYEGSWAGAMVPTDDVLAHLMMMRGDEHRFWRMANQHPAWMVASGL